MQRIWLARSAVLFFVPSLWAQKEAAVVGLVVDSHTGQVLSSVEVQLTGRDYRTQTDAGGHFTLVHVPPGDYQLQASTVGYHVYSGRLHLDSAQIRDLQLVLSPDAFRRRDTVSVHSGSLLNPTGDDEISQFSLTGNDLKNLGTVLADDPLRAVQAAPGVSSNDDFEARFSLRGADPNRVGVYLDGIQLRQAVHTLEGVATSGSNSVFNPDLIEELSLYNGTVPSRFGDSSVAALEGRMRDGNPDRYSYRLNANFAYAGVMAEGPLGKVNQCSWVSGFRKSYLQYLLEQTLADPSLSFGFEDVQGRIACRINPRNSFTLDLLEGDTGVDLSARRDRLGPNSLILAHQKFDVANLGWQYAGGDEVVITSHLAVAQDGFNDVNRNPAPLGSGNYGEWVWNSRAALMWNSNSLLNVGLSVQSIRDSGYLDQYNSFAEIRILDRYRGTGILGGGFLEQSWAAAKGRLHLTTGGRWDHHSIDSQSVFSPQAGLTVSPWSSTQLQFGWGQYAQFPGVSQFTSNLGRRGLLPIRSTQATAAIEQRITGRFRARATFFDRSDRDLLTQPFLDPRLIKGVVFLPPANPVYENSLRGYGRGFELLLQRASANGLTGWISYAYGRTMYRDGATGDSFPSDYDQRHTLNVYESYRIRPTINISGRWTYGSGFPIPAFLESQAPYTETWANVYNLGDRRNRLRVGAYQRLDLRVNKSWTHPKWKATLYAEVVNVTNRANYRFDNFEAFDARSKLAYITVDRMFPILPSLGVSLER